MAGLVGYASSDEESDQEEVQQSPPATKEENGDASDSKVSQPAEAPRADANGIEAETQAQNAEEPRPSQQSPQDVAVGPSQPPPQETVLGPARPSPQDVLVGPTRPPAAGMTLPSLDDEDVMAVDNEENDSKDPPLSPYSAERAAVRQLTMPRVPDFDIPGGDDDDGHDIDDSSAATTKKFTTFLKLRDDGKAFFNKRLAESDAMKNPALMDKLMGYVGLAGVGVVGEDSKDLKGRVDTEVAAAPYGTTLPADIWDPAAFPAEAYRRSLRRLQEDAAKQRARAPGEAVNFVSATAEAPDSSSGQGKRKTRFD